MLSLAGACSQLAVYYSQQPGLGWVMELQAKNPLLLQTAKLYTGFEAHADHHHITVKSGPRESSLNGEERSLFAISCDVFQLLRSYQLGLGLDPCSQLALCATPRLGSGCLDGAG